MLIDNTPFIGVLAPENLCKKHPDCVARILLAEGEKPWCMECVREASEKAKGE